MQTLSLNIKLFVLRVEKARNIWTNPVFLSVPMPHTNIFIFRYQECILYM